MQALDYLPSESPLSAEALRQENITFQGTGGISQNNRSRGFLPAFFDTLSGRTYLSRFADGRLAPIHLLDALPQTLILNASTTGSARRIKHTVISGFVFEQRFYTRAQAAEYMTNILRGC